MAEFYMNLIEKHCGRHQSKLIQCIDKYPVTWNLDCMKEKEKVALCTNKIPEIVAVQIACEKEYSIYDNCVKNHTVDPEACTAELSKFMSCATDSLSTFEKSSNPENKD